MPTCYANPDPIFQSAMRIISSITNAVTPVVTTSFDHDYQTGEIIRFIIPHEYGMHQLSNQAYEITVTSTTTFTIDVDTTNFNPFAIPSFPAGRAYTCAHVVPVGERNDMLSAATRNTLPH